jgi:formamidopyrimidine-DNA glycosylase
LQWVLEDAIARGGTTLRDYVSAEGQPGFFQLDLKAYGRAGLPCPRCAATLRTERIGGRASSFCPRCQR